MLKIKLFFIYFKINGCLVFICDSLVMHRCENASTKLEGDWKNQMQRVEVRSHLCCTTLTGRPGARAERESERALLRRDRPRIGTSLHLSRPARFLRPPWGITRPLRPTEAAACRAAKFACSPSPHSSLLQRGRHVSPKHTWDTHTRGFARLLMCAGWWWWCTRTDLYWWLRVFDGACAPTGRA